ADAFRYCVREERLDRGMIVQILSAAVDEILVADVEHAGVELAGDHHRANALLRRDLIDSDARRRLEADGTGMAPRRRALHEMGHVPRRHAELVLEGAANPQRRGLLIFR